MRPASGDGGIDVIVPTDAENTFDVYQVKYFTTSLSPSQRGQVKRSHTRLTKFAAEKGWTIRKWYLTMPLDPTDGALEWFKTLQGDGFLCEWLGLPVIDGWAADYPTLVDYYVHDSRARIESALREVTKILALSTRYGDPSSTSATLEPRETIDGLTALYDTLNRDDPFYRYAYSVSHAPTGSVPRDPEPAAFAEFGDPDGEHYVSFAIYPRCDESLLARPLAARIRFEAKAGSEEARQLEEYHEYGRPFDIPVDAIYDIDLPGGLGAADAVGKILIGPVDNHDEQGQFERDMSIITESGAPLVKCRVLMSPLSVSNDRKGGSNKGVERNGTFAIEILTRLGDLPTRDPDTVFLEKMTIRTSLLPLDGKFPDQVIDGLRFLASFHHPNRLRTTPVRGPVPGVETLALPPVSQTSYARGLLLYAEALATVQTHTSKEIRITDSTKLEALQVIRAAKLLRGEVLTEQWQALEFSASVADFADFTARLPGAVTGDHDLVVEVSGEVIQLGEYSATYQSAKVAKCDQNADGRFAVRLEPDETNLVKIAWIDPCAAQSGE